MKRLHLVCSFFLLSALSASAQEKTIRPASFGFSIIANDFTTARSIRNSSLETVINARQFAKLSDMIPGVAINYAKGLRPQIDFAASFGYAVGNVVLRNKPDQTQSANVISADASVHFNMLPENFMVIPYVSAGVGATIIKGYYGAILPLGVGMRFKLTDEVSLGLQSQYRVAVTETAGYHFMHGLTVIGSL